MISNQINWKDINGDFYDGDKRTVMERPSIHTYDKTLTMKILLSRPDLENDGESIVVCTYKSLRKFIRELDIQTKGIPKILYLVGWQYEGHDTGYPAFFQVNPRLAEEGEDSAELLREIMVESAVYNTTISLHINMTDAYPGNPLWKEYIGEDLISKRWSGRYLVTGCWYGRKAYQICYTREWESGRAVDRINKLMDLLPLEKAGTVHIDAFFCRPSRFHGISVEQEQAARRKIIRYWRSLGVDVTSEFIYREKGRDDLIGLVPMVWHLNQKKKDYLIRPAQLLCGGNINKDLRGDKKLNRLFGGSTRGESHFSNKEMTAFNHQWQQPFMKDFFTNTLSWYFLNHFKRLSVDPLSRFALLDHNIRTEKKNSVIIENDSYISYGGDLCIPALWSETPLLGVFSQKGTTNREWELPRTWDEIKEVHYEPACVEGKKETIPVNMRKIKISLSKGEGGWIFP
jgi:Endo-alpha-N-acetylgalactosaminidase